ncbi:uncharacterized protein LOC134457955 [Engraulis encrasicolus]|uniref:uncharacterized protein LOC134457955 n=1 Tax=Engraulis encrasicolus TaxID=184585 RepID=UPI002FD16A81
MQPEQVIAMGALQIPSQPVYVLTGHAMDQDHASLQPSQGQSQLSPPLATSSSSSSSSSSFSSSQASCMVSVLPASCSRLEVAVVVSLLTAAAIAILVLLYCVLVLRYKLKVAQARHAMEYWGFFRSASYDLKEPGLPEVFPVPVSVTVPLPVPLADITPGANGTALHHTVDSKPQQQSTPLPPSPRPPPSPPPSPPPPVRPAAQENPSPPPYSEPASSEVSGASSGFSPPCFSTQLEAPLAVPRPVAMRASPGVSPVLRPASTPSIPFPSLPRPLHPLPPPPTPPRPLSAHPLPHPYMDNSPPSPYLSWGACSDVDVYASVGSMRLSRTSSGSQTQVILFEHSAV